MNIILTNIEFRQPCENCKLTYTRSTGMNYNLAVMYLLTTIRERVIYDHVVRQRVHCAKGTYKFRYNDRIKIFLQKKIHKEIFF